MHRISCGRLAAVGLSATALLLGQAIGSAAASAVPASTLPANTHFYTPPPDHGAIRQIVQLAATGHLHDALLVGSMVATPQAVWFTSGTPTEVRQNVRGTAVRAAVARTVPTLVAYNVPGRDCSQYSSGGAGSDTAYRAWADGFAGGLLPGQRVVVVVEPDGLANLPSDCPAAYPGQDVAALTAGRIADIHYAGAAIMHADPNALVYLDAGHSAWHSVGDIAKRLDQAGVREFQGFSLNVSNYQPTPQLDQYGNWISQCLYYANNTAEGGWRVGHYEYCASQYYPADVNDYSTWHLTDEWYAANVDNAAGAPTGPGQLAHYVVDTSRNGRGPWTTTTAYPDKQDWCNPPGRGLGLRPTADTGQPLADAYLWIKTPGQSDGQCNRGIAGSTTDPEWSGITDPAAGAWFPQQALQLARLATPPLLGSARG
jgi:endoglucanase